MAEKKELLIVDDAEENVLFISQILDDHGYSYRVARDGKEAMTKLRERTPDAILLDIMMPRKGGIAVFKEMKQDPALEKIPVIVVTGSSLVTGVDLSTGREQPKEGEGDELARRIGANIRESLQGLEPDGIVEKPIDPQVLVANIKKLTR
jgi:CheY-like chemotaxis protein